MDVQELISGARDALTVKRVFGEPYERNGVTIIPAASFAGGAGGGGDNSPEHGGAGAGLRLMAKPSGVYVVRGDDVSWRPALDLNRVILGAQAVAIALLFTWRSVAKARAKRKR